MILYRVRFSNYRTKIEEVEVERATKKSFWLRGNRYSRNSDGQDMFDTLQQAKGFALKALKNYRDELYKKLAIIERGEKLYMSDDYSPEKSISQCGWVDSEVC